MRHALTDSELDTIRPLLPNKSRGMPLCFSPCRYRDRNQVERFFNRIKRCHRIANRYEKLAANYLAFVKLASIGLWLRDSESTS